ncbi:hypothetical protein E2C01_048540 [Portunus trituberculatus]|uniref:Uncharacterized protein n=1 Tax=Portunus trituberculatus TaxID=210409 RepID=A0A5B7GB79_PORTR|nr:hypothetical protein [Portunus trituberculatus]
MVLFCTVLHTSHSLATQLSRSSSSKAAILKVLPIVSGWSRLTSQPHAIGSHDIVIQGEASSHLSLVTLLQPKIWRGTEPSSSTPKPSACRLALCMLMRPTRRVIGQQGRATSCGNIAHDKFSGANLSPDYYIGVQCGTSQSLAPSRRPRSEETHIALLEGGGVSPPRFVYASLADLE